MVIGDTVGVVGDGTTATIVTTVAGAAVVTHVWWRRREAVRKIILGVEMNVKSKHSFSLRS